MENKTQLITENISNIKKRIASAALRSGRTAKDITLLAVTKNVALDDIRTAITAGVKVLGENKVQEAKKKFYQIGPVVSWHMIGHLQTNKAREASAIFDMVQSIDSERIADSLDQEALRLDRQLKVLVEVNVGDEEQKFGIAFEKAAELVRYVSHKKNLRLSGLMSMAPYVQDPELIRPLFRKMSDLFKHFIPLLNDQWKILSMGMTHDFEVAIEEGSNLVRIGTGIFHTADPGRQA